MTAFSYITLFGQFTSGSLQVGVVWSLCKGVCQPWHITGFKRAIYQMKESFFPCILQCKHGCDLIYFPENRPID